MMITAADDSNSCWSSSQFSRLTTELQKTDSEDRLKFMNELDLALCLHSVESMVESPQSEDGSAVKKQQRKRWSSFCIKQDGIVAIQLCSKKISGEFLSGPICSDLLEEALKKKDESLQPEGLFQEYGAFLTQSNSFDRADLVKSFNKDVDTILCRKFPAVEIESQLLPAETPLFITAEILKRMEITYSKFEDDAENTLPENSYQAKVLVLFLSFLQILLNNRDTVATARALLTDSHQAFTALRKVADSVDMSLCQTAVSFVVRQNLVGSKTVDHRYEGLLEYRPVLAVFVETLHGLQTIMEEHSEDILDCFRRLIRLLRKKLIAFSASSAFQSAVSKAGEHLLESALISNSNLKLLDGNSALKSLQQDTSSGGSMAGKKAMKLIQRVVQRENSGLYFRLTDEYCQSSESENSVCESGTPMIKPVHLPSLLEFFSTPAVLVVDSPVGSGETRELSPSSGLQGRTPLATQDQNKPTVIRLASFLNDDSPFDIAPHKEVLTSPEILGTRRNKENIPPKPMDDADATPKRIPKAGRVKRVSLEPVEEDRPKEKGTKEKNGKKKRPNKSVPKNQMKMTAFFTRV